MAVADSKGPSGETDAMLVRRLSELARPFSGRVGVLAHDLLSGCTAALNQDETFETASTIKVLILVTAFREAKRGTLSLTERLRLTEAHAVRGSGVLADLTPGLELSVRDTLTLMVSVSDNVATNMMIDRLGLEAIGSSARDLGLEQTRLYGPLHFDREPASGVGVTTPAELAALMERIARGEAVGPSEDAEILDILDRNQYGAGLTRDLPYDALEEPGPGQPAPILIASKSGSWDGVRNIVGYVRGSETCYVVCLMSKDCQDPRFHVDNEAMVLLPRLSRVIFDAFSGGPWGLRPGGPA